MDASHVQVLLSLSDSGSVPDLSCHELSSRIVSCVGPQSDGSVPDTQQILCLTLSERLFHRLSSQRLPRDVRTYCEHVLRSLRQMDLMAKLVSLLDCQDQLVSHLSAKCMSAYVIGDVCMTGCSSSRWRHTCAEVFRTSSSGIKLNSCLWSVTAVIKGLLRGHCSNGNDVLIELLVSLDASLTYLYTNLLSPDSMKRHKTQTMKLSVTMCAFFDLLEVLSAARLRCGVCSSVQRTVFIESGALLDVMRFDVKYFVKKRALLLLKRNLLKRAGEDWVLGDLRSPSHEDEGSNEDLRALADVVLREVKAGWLQDVPVKDQLSFFGGNFDGGLGGSQKDEVMLRALSLILLKSLEINIQSPSERGNTEVQQYLTELMTFLKHHGMSPDPHSCSWVTLVFAEQDDDLMESLKALILLYLHLKRLSSCVPDCLLGCNPHCHFIVFLRSISFDHTVMLDFLISTETCFLEYCVRYLKLLRDDWTGFCASCHHVEDGSAGREASDLLDRSAGKDVTAGPVLRLVDYGSSDESEEADASGSGRRSDRGSCRTGGESSECVFDKVLVCLEKLKMAISRLHNRGLFPYNPASLLKLLNNVDAKKNMVHSHTN